MSPGLSPIFACGAAAALVLCSACASDRVPLGFSFEVLSDEVFLDADQRTAAGLEFFPDGLGGVLRDDGDYTFFLPNGGLPEDPTQGTHRFTAASLDTFESLVPSTTDAVLQSGTLRPGPDDFDRNYAGGGTVVRLDSGPTLFHVYYGEYHWEVGDWANFYGSNGLAVSNDGGLTWSKRGEVLRVRLPREDEHVVGSTASAVVREGYVYLYYEDHDPDSTLNRPAVAVAQVAVEDLETLGASGTPAVLKYYEGSFSEPGLSGRFSPIAQDRLAPQSQGSVSVLYSPSLDLEVMVHVVYEADGSWSLAMRSSVDGLVWSEPTTLVQGTADSRVGYPMLMGLDEDPSLLGDTFQLWYVDAFGEWSKANWRRMTLRVR